MEKLQVKFHWDLIEDDSLGVSHSDSSEECLQRSKGGDRIYMNFLLEKKQKQNTTCSLITKNRHLKLMILVLF